MRKFEHPGLVATVPVFADERAAALIAMPHFAADSGCGGADPERAAGGSRATSAWLLGCASLPLAYLLQKRVDCSLDDHGEVAVRHFVGEQISELLELVVGALAKGDAA